MHTLRSFALIALLALSSCALALCGNYACRDDDNCPNGELCYDGTCRDPSGLDDCGADDVCPSGDECVRDKCVYAYTPDAGLR
jgi:hypothetical protein